MTNSPLPVTLLPCPFCGNPNVDMLGPDAVWCGSCLAQMPPHDEDVPNAAARWNTRLTADQQQVTSEREAGLREALGRLVSALDRVHADERYEAVWTIAQLHGAPYAGPTYSAELEAARATLTGSAR